MSKSTNAWAGSGYDVAGTSDSPLYFLSRAGQSARLRLVSDPLRYVDTIPGTNGRAPKAVNRVAWVAILKEIVNDVPTRRVVVFQSTPTVYEQVRKLVADAKYGNPNGYDVIVTRTEDQSSYYTVKVVPGGKPLGDADKKMVKDAAIDLAAVISANATEASPELAAMDEYDPFAE